MFKDYLYYIGFRIRENFEEQKKEKLHKAEKRKIAKKDKEFKLSHKTGFVFQKTAICIAAVLWLIAAGNIIWGKSGYEFFNYVTGNGNKAVEVSTGKIVDAFGNADYEKVTAGISAYGKYSDTAITDKAKTLILEKTAEKIGINRYSITDDIEDGNKVKTLSQTSDNGDVICKFITMDNENKYISEGQQYIYVGVDLKNSIDSAFTYEKIVKELMKDMNIDTTVTVNLCGVINGNVATEDRNTIADNILKKIKAKVVSENKDSDVYTIYAYDKEIKQYITVADEKVNVNISISYDEQNNKTYVYFATPINNRDY